MSENLPDVLTTAVNAIQERHRNQQPNNQNEISRGTNSSRTRLRNIISFWVLGMCNNYGYVVMLSAAHDIIKHFNGVTLRVPQSTRDCNIMSTGVLLLADTIPSMSIKLVAPFLPFFIKTRMTLVCLLSVLGFVSVAAAQTEWHAIVGIIFTSFSCGLGETSLLAYTPKFNKNVLSSWASGTGAAGVGGALSYAFLINIGFSPKSTLLLMLLVPFIQFISFFVVLKESNDDSTISSITSSTTSLIHHTSADDGVAIIQPPLNIKQKLEYLPNMMKYVLPLFTVYVCEYFINQGLYELIYYPNIGINHDEQYRWLQVTYQIGVFVSRSSVNICPINSIWLMSLLQFVNVWYFLCEAIYLTTPNIWIVFAVVFWEGLLGGCCYVNTFNRITKELPQQYKSFGMGFATIGESLGVVTAGLMAIPVHNLICKMPLYVYF